MDKNFAKSISVLVHIVCQYAVLRNLTNFFCTDTTHIHTEKATYWSGFASQKRSFLGDDINITRKIRWGLAVPSSGQLAFKLRTTLDN